MRKFIILAFTLVCSFSSIIAAEYDLIIKTNSEKIEALIQEVSDTELRYKKANNPNGPMFVIKLSEVSSIVYANGEVQAIEHKAQPVQQVQQVQPRNQQGVYGVGRGYNNYGYNVYGGYYGAPMGQVTGALQRVDNNHYMIDGHTMDGRELKYFLAQTCPIAYNYYKTWDNVEIAGWSLMGSVAIEMLHKNAEAFHVSESIRGIAQAIDEFPILPASYDWIIAVSALEHVISKEVFLQKLSEIKEGLRNGGIVSIIMNSSVREFRKRDGMEVAPQFEVNFTAEEAQEILSDTFSDWELLKFSIHDQHYDILRDGEIYELYSKVITYFSRKN